MPSADDWKKLGPGQPLKPERARRPSLAEAFAACRWSPVDWGDTPPPEGKPFAVAQAFMEAKDGRVFRVYTLNDGRYVFDLGYRDGWSAPS